MKDKDILKKQSYYCAYSGKKFSENSLESGEAVVVQINGIKKIISKEIRPLTLVSGLIISVRNNFFFQHIPKNGGTTLRFFLDPINEKPMFNENLELFYSSLIDINHIPLFYLQKNYNHYYEFIKNSDSYAILRNPFDRFTSSVLQRIRMYKGIDLSKLNDHQIEAEIIEVIDFLTRFNPNEILPYDYIHFQRQYDYVFFKNKQIIKNLYLMSDISSLMKSLINKFPNSDLKFIVNENKQNKSKVSRGIISRKIYNLYKHTNIHEIIPRSMIDYFKRKILVDFKSSSLHKSFETEVVKNFINSYYEKDQYIYYDLLKSKNKLNKF